MSCYRSIDESAAAMWRAIGCHAALAAAGLDLWLARMVAELLWRSRPVPIVIPEAAADRGVAVTRALELALSLTDMVYDATGTALAVKAVGTTNHGDAWATIADHYGRPITLRVTEPAEAVINLAGAMRPPRSVSE